MELLHQYYSYTGFYRFVRKSFKKAITPIVLFIGLIFILEYYILDFKDIFAHISETYSNVTLYLIFLVSEASIGLIPPEIYIAWAKTLPNPILNLSLLAIVSYIAGCIAFGIGRLILRIPLIKSTVQIKLEKHMRLIRRWGGLIIVVGALTPLSFPLISMATGVINFSFQKYLLFGLSRFLRFYILALAIFQVVG
ncbi:short-chain dehydrogenase [Puteibacter caeruleilacunae]|nr:short-chain dehydrogenase [Puteibacter caeruleilacunae]